MGSMMIYSVNLR